MRQRMMMMMMRMWHEHILDCRSFEQTFQHAAGATMLQTLVGGQRVFRAISSMTKLTDIQGVRLFVLVLKVAL